MTYLDALPDRILDRIAFEPTTGCWLWIGSHNCNGYGSLWRDGASRLAHREVYEATVGPISPGLTCDHLCRVRCCVNPDHIEPVTNRVNILRGVGATAQKARKSECMRGHPLSGDNVIWQKGGRGRACRTCENARHRRFYAAKMARAKAARIAEFG